MFGDSESWGLTSPVMTVQEWMDPTGTTPQNGPQVQANDVLTQSTVTNGPDKWGGQLAALLDKGVSYALQKDAIKSGLVPRTAANGTQTYQAAGPGAMNMNALWVIGAAVAVSLVLVALTKKG